MALYSYGPISSWPYIVMVLKIQMVRPGLDAVMVDAKRQMVRERQPRGCEDPRDEKRRRFIVIAYIVMAIYSYGSKKATARVRRSA